MANRAGTTESKKDEATKVESEEETAEETAAVELEEKAKEDNKQAKSALTRLEKAVENAREKGWTVSGHVSRLDVYGTSEGTEL